METLLQDLRYGARSLAKNSGFTIVAIITLALGIGANTAVFSAVSAFLLRPLAVRNSARLVTINPTFSGAANQFSYADYRDFRQQATGFSDVLAWNGNLVGISNGNKAEQVVVSMVSANYFSALGLHPYLGQLFAGDDAEKPGADPVIVLGFGYWKQRFNSDPSIIGKQVKVNGRMLTVIGIAPAEFTGLFSIVEMQAYLPLSQIDLVANPNDFFTKRDDREVQLLGFLAPGTTQKQAEASVTLIASRLRRQYPDLEKGLEIGVRPELQSRPSPQNDNSLVVAAVFFLGLAGLVLLLACANIANLLLVRATARRREMAIRAALGAARSRLVRQLLTESLLLAFLGGTAGLALGAAIANIVRSFRLDAGFPMRFNLSLDWRVFAYSCAAVLITGIIVGFAPALRVAKTNVADLLHDGNRGASSGSARSRLRNIFVVSQVAGSFVLLTVAALFVSSLENAERTNLGFDADHVLNLSMDPHLVGLDDSKGKQFYRELDQRVRQLSGVEYASTATMVPLGFLSDSTSVYNQEHPPDKQAAPQVTHNDISEDYFQVMHIPILRGRTFTAADKQDSLLVAIVNQTMAEKMWPGEDAIGKRFSTKATGGPWIEVVGVAANSKWSSPGEPPKPFLYLPLSQNYSSLRTLQVRSSAPAAALIPELEQAIRQLVPDIPIFDVEPMNRALKTGNGFLLYRIGAEFTVAIGLLGLTLALVGVYGVLSYVTAQRTREIGIRLALGAERSAILAMVVRQGFWISTIGIAIGTVISVGGARLFRSVLQGTHSAQPWMPVVVGAFLAAAALLASYLPARRATKIDPIVALRYE